MLSGRGLCDELISRTEESYRLWCVVCDLETSRMRRSWAAAPQQKKKTPIQNYSMFRLTYVTSFREYAQRSCLVKNTVELGYYDLELCDSSAVKLYFLWY